MLFLKGILFLCVIKLSSASPDLNFTDLPSDLLVYRNLDELLEFFKNDKSQMANDILETFHTECPTPRVKQLKKDPANLVIVIEGNHRKTRDFVCKGLAYMMNARSVCHPAPCLRKYFAALSKGSFLRRAFFHLSNYAASQFISTQPYKTTIVNGYWSEQFAFTMGHHYPPGKLPSATDEVFKLPNDLVKPDIIFYLNFADSHLNSYATTRNPWSWKPRTMEVMRALEVTHPIIYVGTRPVMKLVTEEVYRHVEQYLQQRSTTPASWNY